ncbi:MAG: universal stress protein [Microbacterium sp.]|nr:MAG: universal stress protein [Microbacterium sp.]
MTVIALHEHSDVGRLALRTANAEAELRNTQLIVLFALSGSDEPHAEAAERDTIEADVRDVLPSGNWTLKMIHPGRDHVGALVEEVGRIEHSLVVLGTPHRSPVGKIFLGRDHQRLLLEIDSPVLVVKLREHHEHHPHKWHR